MEPPGNGVEDGLRIFRPQAERRWRRAVNPDQLREPCHSLRTARN